MPKRKNHYEIRVNLVNIPYIYKNGMFLIAFPTLELAEEYLDSLGVIDYNIVYLKQSGDNDGKHF